MHEPILGDGFGLGWYSPGISHEPAVFAAVSPAWNNRNLRYMTPKLVSPTIFIASEPLTDEHGHWHEVSGSHLC